MNKAGLDLLKHYEGFRDCAYRDIAGVWTIGFGFTDDVKPGDKCSMDEALVRLKAEIAPREQAVWDACKGYTPNENQLAAMTSLCFNIGTGNFKGSTVLRKHNLGDWAGASSAFLLWDKATIDGKLTVVPGLVKRRHAERELYLS